LLLIDIGATSNEHCADMSRTYPVSGRFTARQLDLYQLVLEGEKKAATSARTGVDSVSDLDHLVRDFFRASPLRAKDSNGVETTMDKFFVHSIGHYVGRQVHGADTGWKLSMPIDINQVFTLEPGLYIASESIGIRIEDTYVVRTHALECLTCAAHKEPAEVQRLW
jgi:Xaa-Pro aminopeptidase